MSKPQCEMARDQALKAEADHDKFRKALEEIRALHKETDTNLTRPTCSSCTETWWPCPTVSLIDEATREEKA